MGGRLEIMAKPLDTTKLRKALLVMLSSDQPGEIMAASALARKLLGAAEHDIHWLVDQALDGRWKERKAKPKPPPEHQWKPGPPDPARPAGGWQDMLDLCSMQYYGLTTKDQEFIYSLDNQRLRSRLWQPSGKQMEWLIDIYEKIIQGRYR